MQRIMIIRHAEKPHDRGPDHGVTINGVHDKHDLTVRGWQRAGALVHFFAPAGGLAAGSPVATPRTILASSATIHSPSLRAQHTVRPLAAWLALTIDNRHADGEETDIAAAALAAESPVLIAWHHHHIAVLAGLIASDFGICPPHWPDDRFDIVWILDRDGPGAPWRFSQTPQCLLPDDRPGTL